MNTFQWFCLRGISIARNIYMKQWETTLCGILTIVGSVCTAGIAFLHGQTTVAISALSAGIPTGVGLMRAKDANKQ